MTTTLHRIPTIVDGEGALAQLGTEVASLVGPGASVLLVADPGLPAGMADEALATLRRAGLAPTLFDALKSDPTTAQADAGAGLARSIGARAVVALGGGSAMDVGKAVAVIAPGSASAAAYALCAIPFPASALPCVCVPTTSGTGSETTRTAVLTDPEGRKIWLWGDAMKPALVVLDPLLTLGLPPHLTAATGIDALVHAMEAATSARAHPLSDVSCHAAIALVARHLEAAVANGQNRTARAALQRAAALAGIGIDAAGTSVGHMIGHAMGSLRPIHHGRAVGLAVLATLPWSVSEDDGPFASVAVAMGEAPQAARVPAAFERLLRSTGIRVSIAEEFAGIDAATLAAQMARPENAPMRQSSRRQVDDADLGRFAQTVLTQT
jgi:alcohol dehydrogenase class IV